MNMLGNKSRSLVFLRLEVGQQVNDVTEYFWPPVAEYRIEVAQTQARLVL